MSEERELVGVIAGVVEESVGEVGGDLGAGKSERAFDGFAELVAREAGD